MTTTGSFMCIGVAFKIPYAPKSISVDQGRKVRAVALGMVFMAQAALSHGQMTGSYHEAGFWAGRSFHIFGSHEIRDSLGFFYGSAKPDRRLSHRNVAGHLVYEGYFEFNSDTGDREVLSPYQTGAIGGLALLRWTHRSMFFDLGLGVQAQNHVGHDLPAFLNTTPTAGLGWVVHSGPSQILLGVRFLHISNANTHRENAGQNQVLLYLSVLSF